MYFHGFTWAQATVAINFLGAHAYTVKYFKSRILYQVPVEEIRLALEKAHPYMDVHIATLCPFNLQMVPLVCHIPEGERPIGWQRWELTTAEHLCDTYSLDATLCLPGKEEYKAHAKHCVPECELKPFHWQTVPPPHRPQTTSSPSKPLPVEDSSTALYMSAMTYYDQNTAGSHGTKSVLLLAFSAPTKKQVTVLIPRRISAPAAPLTCKRQHEQEASNTNLAANISVKPQPTRHTNVSKAKPTKASALATTALKYTLKSRAPAPSNINGVVKKPALPDLSSASEAEPAPGEGDDAASVKAIGLNAHKVERNELEVLPVKKPRLTLNGRADPPPPPPLKCAPLLPPVEPSSKAKGKTKAVAPALPPVISPSKWQRLSQGKKLSCSFRGSFLCRAFPRLMQTSSPTAKGNLHTLEGDDKALLSMEVENVDNIIYAWAFHPQVDLQFHEPPLHQALEYMKLSMLPPAPDSFTKPSHSMRNGCDSLGHATTVPWLASLMNASLKTKLVRRSVPSARPAIMALALRIGMPINYIAQQLSWTLLL
ncbi:hypothetical protein ARMSODRAFT_974491 [Armillaria solidipes]|uniref:Uncharacterized protein n=1 Tax=Armillaria solidipes TaxID=1076256 RepID=A0A2H3BI57_9AGAR|nr:hypothetical protein ARMSODRAFT_974491 [Armillaria solidipes]